MFIIAKSYLFCQRWNCDAQHRCSNVSCASLQKPKETESVQRKKRCRESICHPSFWKNKALQCQMNKKKERKKKGGEKASNRLERSLESLVALLGLKINTLHPNTTQMHKDLSTAPTFTSHSIQIVDLTHLIHLIHYSESPSHRVHSQDDYLRRYKATFHVFHTKEKLFETDFF